MKSENETEAGTTTPGAMRDIAACGRQLRVLVGCRVDEIMQLLRTRVEVYVRQEVLATVLEGAAPAPLVLQVGPDLQLKAPQRTQGDGTTLSGPAPTPTAPAPAASPCTATPAPATMGPALVVTPARVATSAVVAAPVHMTSVPAPRMSAPRTRTCGVEDSTDPLSSVDTAKVAGALSSTLEPSGSRVKRRRSSNTSGSVTDGAEATRQAWSDRGVCPHCQQEFYRLTTHLRGCPAVEHICLAPGCTNAALRGVTHRGCCKQHEGTDRATVATWRQRRKQTQEQEQAAQAQAEQGTASQDDDDDERELTEEEQEELENPKDLVEALDADPRELA